jgi:succinyl-CoA synthetase beta subunit
VEIEKVAAETPEKIHKEHFHPQIGLHSYQVRKLCWKLGITGASVRSAEKFMKGICKLNVDLDCSLAEINPLVITKSGEMLPLVGRWGSATWNRARVCGQTRYIHHHHYQRNEIARVMARGAL